MFELVIPVQKYIGESGFNWDTLEFEPATSASDVRMFVEYAQYTGQTVDSICFEIGTCFGGSTIDGTEIYNYAQSLGIPIRTRILSFAASMATILMLVGEECEIDASASIMVHAPSMETWGTAKQIGANLKGLTDTEKNLRDIYVARTGQPVEVVEQWMSKDTFFTAQEALEVGLVTKVIPIAPRKAAVQLTDAQASARRSRYAGIVARADKRPAAVRAAAPKPKAKSAAQPAPTTPRPMSKTAIAAGASTARRPAAAPAKPVVAAAKPAAAKPAAAKPTALSANEQAVAAFAKQMGVAIKMEGAAEVIEPTAEVVATVLADGDGTLYTDGELAQGSAVFNDEALTVATGDGIYGTEDGRDITIAAGVVESIANTEAAAEAASTTPDTEAITAAITVALAPITKELNDMRATFNKAVPPAPRARGVVQGPDAKTATPKAKGILKGASAQA